MAFEVFGFMGFSADDKHRSANYVEDYVRHEALSDRVGVRDLHHPAVAAAG